MTDKDDAPASTPPLRRLGSLRTLWPFVRRHMGLFVAWLAALAVSSTATLSLPAAVKRMIDHGFSGGGQINRAFALLMLVAVVLTAAATAIAGPISFIALVAPHIARRLSGTARWGLTQSALCGSLLLLAADLCAQRLFMPYQLPVGVVTVSLGGIYLIVLLVQESRKK